jgi:hypothetical protein
VKPYYRIAKLSDLSSKFIRYVQVQVFQFLWSLFIVYKLLGKNQAQGFLIHISLVARMAMEFLSLQLEWRQMIFHIHSFFHPNM